MRSLGSDFPGDLLGSKPIGETTRLLQLYSGGDEAAAEELHAAIYDELRSIAQHFMDGERPDHTLQPTALVNEAFLRLVEQRPSGFDGRDHFLRLAARAMRFALVDHARAKKSAKRGGGQRREALDVALAYYEDRAPAILELEDVLSQLERLDPQIVRIVDLRFFGGHTIEETARILGVSHGTVENGWRTARLWLAKELDPNAGGE
jgi:RNA polymerase sigma factor (TIGR02999 family)